MPISLLSTSDLLRALLGPLGEQLLGPPFQQFAGREYTILPLPVFVSGRRPNQTIASQHFPYVRYFSTTYKGCMLVRLQDNVQHFSGFLTHLIHQTLPDCQESGEGSFNNLIEFCSAIP